MGFPVWPAKGVVKGRVKEADFHVKRNSLTLLSRNINPSLYPMQLNSMGDWMDAIYKECTPEIQGVIKAYYKDMVLSVNGGQGRKVGRKNQPNDNTFSYRVENPDAVWLIDLRIQTRPHAAVYQEEVRKGLRTPTPRNPFETGRKEPWYSTSLGRYVYPSVDVVTGELTAYDLYADYSLFLSDYRMDKGSDVNFPEESFVRLVGDPTTKLIVRDNKED